MYRFLFRPKWLLFHAVVLAAIVAMIGAGFWQLRRLDERKDFNARLIERSELAPIDLEDLAADFANGTTDIEAVEWRRVRAAGVYVPEQLVQFNRSQGGRSGENVLTALTLEDGTTAIVNRGFVQLGVAPPAAPPGDVEVIGYVRKSEERGRGGVTDDVGSDALTAVRRIEVPLIAPQLPGKVVPFYVQLIDSNPVPGALDPQAVTLPELSNGPHLSYAVQWFTFALCVAIGWVLAVRRSLRTHRHDVATVELTDR